jgi:hypothetical protein
VRNTHYDSFNYADITKTRFYSSRSVNPLTPCYQIRDENGNLATVGDIPGSSPKKLPERKTGGFYNGLETGDISGTKCGSKT